MKRIITGTSIALLVTNILAGCSSSGTTTASANPVPTMHTSPQEALRTTIQGYMDALLSGDGAGISSYIDPACNNSFGFLAASMSAGIAKGARLIIDSVYVDEQGGGTDTYHLTPDAPDALRRFVKTLDTGKHEHSFRLINGEWFKHPDPCDSPTSSSTPRP